LSKSSSCNLAIYYPPHYKRNGDALAPPYLLKNQEQILTKDEDIRYLDEKGIRLIKGDILDSIQYVKHDAKKVSKILLDEFISNSKTKEFKI